MSTCIYMYIIRYFSFFYIEVFKIQHIFHTHRVSQFGIATFQVLCSCMWLMATKLDSTALTCSRLLNKLPLLLKLWHGQASVSASQTWLCIRISWSLLSYTFRLSRSVGGSKSLHFWQAPRWYGITEPHILSEGIEQWFWRGQNVP